MSLLISMQSLALRLTMRRMLRPAVRLLATKDSWEVLSTRIADAGTRFGMDNGNVQKMEEVDGLIATLTAFKAQHAAQQAITASSSPHTPAKPQAKKANAQDMPLLSVDSVITPRSTDYSAWYNDVVHASDMVDHSPVRGCMVIKPWGMDVWDLLRSDLDRRIRAAGVSNAYFPLFIPLEFLAKEAEHVDGFAKECAVVTHHRLSHDEHGVLRPDPAAKLDEPLIVRPTSETIIWKMFHRWIGSHRDLPMKMNQWANVVRWELRTRPFLRTTEFLWQEGHTAHATEQEATSMSLQMLDVYSDVCEEMLAMPTIKGEKSPSERFAGASNTYTIESLMQNGWALQSGTSHFLGQNFARAFDVKFQNEKGQREHVWATSWGVSTRLLGGMIMTHSDDKGLVLPPRVAPFQVVIVPITIGKADKDTAVLDKAKELATLLRASGLRVHVDDRDNMRPGAKYFEWERKGLPLRLELGPKDLAKGQVMAAHRHTGAKEALLIGDELPARLSHILSDMQAELLANAKKRLQSNTHSVSSYEQMKAMLDSTSEGDKGFYLAAWKCNADNEKAIKDDCKATIRCYPFEHNQQPPADGMKCFYSGEQATHMALFARAF